MSPAVAPEARYWRRVAPRRTPARQGAMHSEYTPLPSAEEPVGSGGLLLAAAASTFGSHDPYSNSSAAPYAPHEGSHSLGPHEGSDASQPYEPVQAVVETHGVEASGASQAQQATRKRGRPPGSKNKPHAGPPKTRKGRSHDDDWYQGKFSLQPNISMVCLAAIDKATGHASRGCGMVLPPESNRWVAAKKVKHEP